MKKAILLGASLVFALLPITASAGDTKGFGTAVCSDLVEGWNESDEDTRGVVIVAIGQWAFGYMSGRNAELPQLQRKELASLDSDETAISILEQCVAFPNTRVYQVVDIIFNAAPSVSAGA